MEQRTIDLAEPWSGWVHIETTVPNKEQPRTFFDTEELARLGDSLRTGQANPSTVIAYTDPSNKRVRWKLGDGERRLRALRNEGLVKVWVTYSPSITEGNLHEVSFKSNCCRQGHTHVETARAIDRELRTGKKYQQIGAMVGKGYQWAMDEHRLLRLEPDLLKLIDPPTPKDLRIPMSVAKELSKLPVDQQIAEWEKVRAAKVSRGRMALILQAGQNPENARSRGRGGRPRRPSDDISIIKNRLRRIREDLRIFTHNWRERLETFMPGVDPCLMVEALDGIQSEAQELRQLLVSISAKPKTSGEPPKPSASASQSS